MPLIALYLCLGLGSLFVFIAVFAIGKYIASRHSKPKLFVSSQWWRRWEQAVQEEGDEKWEKLLARAGRPFGWGKPER